MHAWVVPAMAVVSLGPAAHTVEHIIFSQWSRNGGGGGGGHSIHQQAGPGPFKKSIGEVGPSD